MTQPMCVPSVPHPPQPPTSTHPTCFRPVSPKTRPTDEQNFVVWPSPGPMGWMLPEAPGKLPDASEAPGCIQEAPGDVRRRPRGPRSFWEHPGCLREAPRGIRGRAGGQAPLRPPALRLEPAVLHYNVMQRTTTSLRTPRAADRYARAWLQEANVGLPTHMPGGWSAHGQPCDQASSCRCRCCEGSSLPPPSTDTRC